MLRVVRRKSLGIASLVLVAWASGCGDDQGASESKHGQGGSSGLSGAATSGSATAGSAGVATGGAGGRAGAGAGGVMMGGGAGRGGGSGTASGGTAGASGDAGAAGETDGGQGGEAGMGGEGGAVGGDGGTSGTGANGGTGGAGAIGGSGGLSGSGGMSGSGGAGGSAGMAGMSGVGGLGGAGVGGAGGAGVGGSSAGAGAGNAGGGGTGGAGIPGLDVPCQNGLGWTLFRWHYAGSTTPVVDVWDATCSYSASASSTCTIETIGGVSLTQGNTALVIDGSDELRARFSVQGLSFAGAAVYVRARSFSTNASTNIRVASVLHGESVMGPVDQDFTFDWYGMDWTGNLLPSDAPLATAVRIYPYQGANALAIMSVEVCLR